MSKNYLNFQFSTHSRFILLVYWICLITYVSHAPSQILWEEDTRTLFQIIRYDYKEILAHIGEFFILTYLALTTFLPKTKLKVILFFLSALSFAFLDEIHQYFVPGRSSSFFDIICDLIGIILAILIYTKYVRKKT